jgi:signal transduction histidine kinase
VPISSAGFPLHQKDPLESRILFFRAFAILGQFCLALGAAFIIYSFFPALQPAWIAVIALVGVLLLQPLRSRLQNSLPPRPNLREETIPAWVRAFQELVASSDDADRAWRALEEIVRSALVSRPVYLFRLRPETGAFHASGTDFSFSSSGVFTAAVAKTDQFQPLTAISASPGEIARLESLRIVETLALHGKDGCVGFIACGSLSDTERGTAEAHSFLRALADSFRAWTATEEPDWTRLGKQAEDIQSIPQLCEWLYAQLAPWVPVRSFRMVRILRDQSLGCNLYCIEDGRLCADQQGVVFPMDSDICSLAGSAGMAVFVTHSLEACRAHGIAAREPDGAWGGIPLAASGNMLGLLAVSRDSVFTESDRARLSHFAYRVSPVLARLIWREQSARGEERMRVIRRIARRLSDPQNAAALFQTLLEGACELAGASRAALFLADRDGNWKAEVSLGADIPERLPISGGFQSAARLAAPTYIASAANEETLRSLFPNVERALLLPVRHQNQMPAVLAIADPTGLSPFPSEEDNYWFAFAAMASMAMQTLRLSEQTDPSLSSVVENLASLQRLDQDLNTAGDIRGALTVALDWAIGASESAAGFAVLQQPAGLEFIVARGYPSAMESEISCDLALLEEAMRAGKPTVFLHDTAIGFPGRLPGAAAALVLPIQRADQTLGAFFLEADWEGAFSLPHLEILQRLTTHAATAIAHAQLRAEVFNTNQAKSEFISFVAHELKTPMTSIRGYTDLLAQGAVGPVNPSQANFLGTIRTNADRLATLVSDLNDVSRIETGRMRLEFSQCSLSAALEEVLESLHALMEAKEQTVTVDVSPHLPPVWADRDRLVQILTNLVSNAHKYTPAGGSMQIAAERSSNRWDESGAADVLHVSIQDSGLGISPQDQKSIFQKFFRAEDRSVRDLPGTGLGLHITRNLIELQGGRIWFETELRKGSTFHFTLPVASL